MKTIFKGKNIAKIKRPFMDTHIIDAKVTGWEIFSENELSFNLKNGDFIEINNEELEIEKVVHN